MVDHTGFCAPSQEMDDISRKLRAGEGQVDYARLFARTAKPVSTMSDEADPVALSIRMQSEKGLSVEAASAAARSHFSAPTYD